MLKNLEVVTACNAIGFFAKNYVKFIPNSLIPVVLAVAGVVLNCIMQGAFTLDNAIVGLTSGLASVGTYETYKGFSKITAPKDQVK